MRRFLTGNILLILCCVFYLAWWVVAFKPVGAVKGFKSGWLLIPAAILGLGSVIMICQGVSATEKEAMLIPASWIVTAGVILYVVLLAGTWVFMKRPVTTELFLIVGWAALTVAEVSALYGSGAYGKAGALAMILCIIVLAVISLVCYLLYYNLDSVKGYYDGMVPLVIVAVMMAIISITSA